jgi:hypothetical protein
VIKQMDKAAAGQHQWLNDKLKSKRIFEVRPMA